MSAVSLPLGSLTTPPTQSLPPFSRLPSSPVSGRVIVQAGEMGLSIRTPGSGSLESGGGAVHPIPVSREPSGRKKPCLGRRGSGERLGT